MAQKTQKPVGESKPVKVTVVNKMPEKASESKDEDPIKTLKAEAVRTVFSATDLIGGVIMLGLAGLAIALFKIPGGGEK